MNSETEKAIRSGAILNVDFKERKAVLNGKVIDISSATFDIEKLRELYDKFYNSVLMGDINIKKRKQKNYFIAKHCDELTQEELFTGQQRSLAKADLELYVLGCIVADSKWPFDEKHWFYRDEKYPSLVLLKEWWCA